MKSKIADLRMVAFKAKIMALKVPNSTLKAEAKIKMLKDENVSLRKKTMLLKALTTMLNAKIMLLSMQNNDKEYLFDFEVNSVNT